MYSAAVVGCGRIGGGYRGGDAAFKVASHASAYAAEPRTQLLAAADTDPEALERFGRRWQVQKLFSDYEEMLDAVRPQIVSVCLWDEGHGAAVRAAVQCGARAVLCEKPLAPTWREAVELTTLCQSREVLLLVGYQRRWERRHRQVRDFIRSGGLGDLLAVNGYYVGGLRHNGCAWINLARFLAGEIVQVQALGSAPRGQADPSLSVGLVFASGASGSLHAGDREAYSLFEVELLGTQGRLCLASAGYEIRYWGVEEDERFAGFRRLQPRTDIWGESEMDLALHGGVRQLVDCLEGSGQAENPGWDAVADMQLVEAICESAMQMRPVQVTAVDRG